MNKISIFGFAFLMALLTSNAFATEESENNANFRKITCKVSTILNQPATGTLVVTQDSQFRYTISINLTSKDNAYSVASSSNPILADLLPNSSFGNNKIEFTLMHSRVSSPTAPTVESTQNGTLTIDLSNSKNITAQFIGLVAYQSKLLGKTKIDAANCAIQ